MPKSIKHIISNDIIGWPTADQAVVSGGNFLIALLLARYIGMGQYGVFVLTWMIVLFFSSVHQATIIAPLQTILPKLEGNKLSNLFHSLLLNILFVAVCIVVLLLGILINNFFDFIPSFDHGYELALVIASFLCYDYLRKSFYVTGQVKWSFVLSAVAYILPIACIFYFGKFGALDVSRTLLLMAAAFAVAGFIGFLKVVYTPFSWPDFKSLVANYFRFSKWLTCTSLLQWFNSHVFVISSSAILGPAAAGGIRICQNVVGVLHIVFLSIENVIPIKAAEQLSANGVGQMLNYLNRFSLKFGVIVAMMLAVVFVKSEYILELAYGEQYVQHGYLLRGFSLLYILVFLAIPLKIALRTLERTKSLFFVYVVSAVLGALVSTPFILRWHYFGVIAGLVTVQVVVLLGYVFSIRKEIKNYANHSFSIR